MAAETSRSWEFEIVISGMIIVIVFDLPEKIRLLRESILLQAASPVEMEVSAIAFNGISAIAFSFSAILILHLLVRTIWIGILGLRTIHDHPSLGESAERLNALASRLFGLWIVSAWLIALFAGVAIGLTPAIIYFLGIGSSWSLLLLLPAYTLLCWLAKKAEWGERVAYMKYIPSLNIFRLRHSAWPGRLESGLDTLLLWTMVKPVLEVLERSLREIRSFRIVVSASGMGRGVKYIFTLITAGILVFLGIAANHLTLKPTVGNVTDASLFAYDSYESMIPADNTSHITQPTIQDQVIETKQLRVFIPVLVSDNVVLEERHGSGVLFKRIVDPKNGVNAVRRAQLLRWSLRCVAALFEMRIDDSIRVSPRFLHHIHPNNEEYGLLGFVDITDLAPGMHVLHVCRMNEVDGGDKIMVSRQDYTIPFMSLELSGSFEDHTSSVKRTTLHSHTKISSRRSE